MQKECYRCKFFQIEYDRDWSEYTPGSGFSMMCLKGHWSFSGETENISELRKCYDKAKNCPDFILADILKG